jgi:hypothetical protein
LNQKSIKGDVCIVSPRFANCWENISGTWRDLYYTDIPFHLKKLGLEVIHIVSPDFKENINQNKYPVDIVCQFHSMDIIKATMQTVVFQFKTFRLLIKYFSEWKKHTRLCSFAIELLINFCLLQRNLTFFYAFKRIFSQIGCKIILFYDEIYFSGRSLQLALNSIKNNLLPISIGMQHGIVSDDHLIYFTDTGDAYCSFPTPDYFFVQNELVRKCYQRFTPKKDMSRLKNVGLHRVEKKNDFNTQNLPEQLLALDKDKTIFLLLGGRLSEQKIIWDILLEVNREFSLQLIVKPHHLFPWPRNWLDQIHENDNSKLIYLRYYDINQLIYLSDYVISSVSTAIINVIFQKKFPIIFNYQNRIDVSHFFKWLQSQNDAIAATNTDQLKAAIIRSAMEISFEKLY